MKNTNKRVLIGLSGGVDSAVAALTLKNKGYDVIGATMITNDSQMMEQAVSDAELVADAIGIDHVTIDFRKEFKEFVTDYFCDTYIKGMTPNPCIMCNRYVKWESLLKKADEMGADHIATGHYAKIIRRDNGRLACMNASSAKDQTYALFRLTQSQLSRTIFPIGELEKTDVRRIAADNNIPVADKADSQDICFIPDNDYAGFIRQNRNVTFDGGCFVTTDGRVLGRHKGIIHYTVGQRKGLGLSLGRPCFVTEIRPDTNEVVIGFEDDVLSSTLTAGDLSYMGSSDFESEGECIVKIRYNHKGAAAFIKEENGMVKVTFKEPQKAITPGQAAVFYKNGQLLGGGIIIGR